MEVLAVRVHCPSLLQQSPQTQQQQPPADPAAFRDQVASHLRHDPVAFALATDSSHWATGRGWPHAIVSRHDWAANAPAATGGAGTSFEVSVDLGGSLEDAWALAHLLLALTRPATSSSSSTSFLFGRRCFVTVESAEGDMGDFLLVEAADSLADWCCPEVMAHRVVLYDGRVAVIPPTPALQPADGGVVRRAMLAAWERYGLDGGRRQEVDGASPPHEEPRPLESIDVPMRFFADIVVPTVCQATTAYCGVGEASGAAPFAAALERTLFPNVVVTEAIGVRAQREASDLVRHRQRVCALLPLFAAAVLQRRPPPPAPDASSTAEAPSLQTTAASLAARALAAFRETVPVALKTADGVEALLAQIRVSPFMPAAADAEGSVDQHDLVKISLSLPRFAFAFALFTDLPATLGGAPQQQQHQATPPLRPTPQHVAELGAKIAIGMTCLLASGDAVLLERIAYVESTAVASGGAGSAAQAAAVDVVEAPPADLGDGYAWMHAFAAESAAQDAAWTKGDFFADLATRLAATDSDDTDGDDDSSETTTSGSSDASPTAHFDHVDEEQRWSSTTGSASADNNDNSSKRRAAAAAVAKDDAAWRWAQDAADALAEAAVADGNDVNEGGPNDDDADDRGALRQWQTLLSALASDGDAAAPR